MKIYNTNHISTINFTNHSTPYIMTDTQKFQHTRGLEKQVRDLQAVVQRLLFDAKSMEKDTINLTIERDAWKERACDLQCK